MTDRTISITLSDDAHAFIESEVAAGHFADEGEVVRAAIGRLEHDAKVKALKAMIAEGVEDFERGDFKTFTKRGEMARYVLDNLDALK
jgi:putative addiction module CopG family antidote